MKIWGCERRRWHGRYTLLRLPIVDGREKAGPRRYLGCDPLRDIIWVIVFQPGPAKPGEHAAVRRDAGRILPAASEHESERERESERANARTFSTHVRALRERTIALPGYTRRSRYITGDVA